MYVIVVVVVGVGVVGVVVEAAQNFSSCGLSFKKMHLVITYAFKLLFTSPDAEHVSGVLITFYA
jgi:hypothetical protein